MSDKPKLNYEYVGSARGKDFYSVSVEDEPRKAEDPEHSEKLRDLMDQASKLCDDMKAALAKKT